MKRNYVKVCKNLQNRLCLGIFLAIIMCQTIHQRLRVILRAKAKVRHPRHDARNYAASFCSSKYIFCSTSISNRSLQYTPVDQPQGNRTHAIPSHCEKYSPLFSPLIISYIIQDILYCGLHRVPFSSPVIISMAITAQKEHREVFEP